MRLLRRDNLDFEEFEDEDTIPRYIILSHYWEQGQEISFQDMKERTQQTMNKSGFKKITKAAQMAKSASVDYIWIDTCCIDKGSSAELTEAINCKRNE
jgi:Heterokaryon incompatibility protein (HET)